MNIPNYIEQLPDEEWREIEGSPNYLVSNMGRVLSFLRPIAKVLKSPRDSDGYSQVTLNDRKNHKVHKLVWRAFVGVIAVGYEINHIDTDKSNNRLNNLEAVSPNDNQRHAYANGLQKQDRSTSLSLDDRTRIRQLIKDGLSCRVIGDMYGVSRVCIALIKSGKRHAKDLER